MKKIVLAVDKNTFIISYTVTADNLEAQEARAQIALFPWNIQFSAPV